MLRYLLKINNIFDRSESLTFPFHIFSTFLELQKVTLLYLSEDMVKGKSPNLFSKFAGRTLQAQNSGFSHDGIAILIIVSYKQWPNN